MRRAPVAAVRACALSATILLVCAAGCRREHDQKEPTTYLDTSITRFHPMGWLGGRAHPATRTVEVPDLTTAGRQRAVGGMVVTEVTSDAPLARAGVMRGDVIVRAGETWLPNKEDPNLDLIRILEAEISGGIASIELGVLRSGKVTTITLEHGLVPLEVGLPTASERLSAMTRAGLDKLAGLQQPDGSFTGSTRNADEVVMTCAVAGLAFVAGGSHPDEGPHAEALALCRNRVETALADESITLGSWPTVWATMFIAELDHEDFDPIRDMPGFKELYGD